VSTLVFVLIIAVGVVLCLPMIVRLRPVVRAYRSGALTGRKAVAIGTSRVVLAFLGVITIASLTSARIMTDLTTAHITKSMTQADHSANAFQSQLQRQNQAQTADLKNEATKILAAIQQHTPAGQSPRSVALSQLPGWLPELQQGAYDLTPSAGYATTGQISIEGLADYNVGPVCLTVPSQVVASSQYAAYVSRSACPS
jgi:energy-converting hydrogenase Eha subunit A